MLYRKRQKDIERWVQEGTKALLVTGARQIGKTYLIEETLKKTGVSYVKLNLIEQPEILDVLKPVEKKDIGAFITRLSLLTNKELIKKETIIFIDEVQEYKEILTIVKFLVEDGSFKYIFSGSLLGVELRNLRSAPVGYLNIIKMYPMDLEEFLFASGLKGSVLDGLKECYYEKRPVDSFVHDKIMEAFNVYLVVGGMPEVVQTYFDTKDFNKVIDAQNRILPAYQADFTKYEEDNKKLKIQKTYNLIPSEINSKNKRFMLSHLEKDFKMERYIDSFEWLINAGVALPIYNTTEPKIPLEINKKANLFKLFLSDIGLLNNFYGKPLMIKILNQDSNVNCGAIYENFVAQELIAHGYNGYYFSNKKMGELDFVIEHNGYCLPIEVKSGKDYKYHSALNNVLNNKNFDIKEAYVLSNNNMEIIDKICYLPIYMIMFIDENDITIPKKNIDLSEL